MGQKNISEVSRWGKSEHLSWLCCICNPWRCVRHLHTVFFFPCSALSLMAHLGKCPSSTHVHAVSLLVVADVALGSEGSPHWDEDVLKSIHVVGGPGSKPTPHLPEPLSSQCQPFLAAVSSPFSFHGSSRKAESLKSHKPKQLENCHGRVQSSPALLPAHRPRAQVPVASLPRVFPVPGQESRESCSALGKLAALPH